MFACKTLNKNMYSIEHQNDDDYTDEACNSDIKFNT